MIKSCNKLARAATRAGMILLESGAETYRVEDTMKRICLSYGAQVVDSYATPTLLIISFSLDEELCHNVKRTQIKNVDLSKIDKVNDLSRTIASEQLSLDAFHDKLLEIDNEKKYSDRLMVLGAAICTFGFALFFGGSIMDAISACLIGIILKIITIQLDKIDFTSFFKYLVSGAFVTCCSIIFMKLNICDNLDTTIISVDMLLVPGLAITNAIRDTVSGDLVSGLARTAEAFFIAIAIAIGSGIVFMLLGGY